MVLNELGNPVDALLDTADAITNYGILTVQSALNLLIMFFMLRHFIKQNAEMFNKVLNNQEGAFKYETPMEQIQVLQSALFNLAKFEVLSQMHRIFKENNLHDKESVKAKIRDVLNNVHSERNSRLDNFKYHGIKLSMFTNEAWVDRIASICFKQLYINEKEFNTQRFLSALDVAYDHMKIEFYNNIIKKS